MLQDILRLSASTLERDAKQLKPQVCGRWPSFSCPEIEPLLAQARGWATGAGLYPITPTLTRPDGPLVRSLNVPGGVSVVRTTPNGDRIVSAEYNMLWIWELQRGELLNSWPTQIGNVNDMCITPDGQRAIIACDGNILTVCDLRSGNLIQTLKGHTASVCAVCVTPDG